MNIVSITTNIKSITSQTMKSIFNLNKSSFITTLIVAIFCCSNSFATNRTWVATSNSNWNNSANWSPAAVPGSSDIAIFSNSSVFNCSIDAAVNVAGIQINAGYTGTVSQNAQTITFGASGFTQAAGTFTGGTVAINGSGTFSLSAGTFTSTSGVFTQTASFTVSGGTFNHNNGSFVFNGGLTITGTISFYNVSFNGNGVTYTIANTLTVNNTFTTTGANYAAFSGGTMNLLGNITLNNTFNGNNGHTTLVNISGTGNQTFTGGASAYISRFPSVTINKASGTLYLANYITIEGNFTYTAGTIDHTTNSNRLVFVSNGKTITTNAALTTGDVEFNGTGSSYTLTTTAAFNVAGTLYITGSSYGALMSGTINAQGNITVSNTYVGNMGHTATININGSGIQTLTGASTAYQGSLPNIIIAKNVGSGTLYLSGNITIEDNFTYTSGTIDYTTNANRVIFPSNGKTITTNAVCTLGNVEFYGTGNSYTLTTTSTFNIAGTMYITGSSYGAMLSGTIYVQGSINNTNSYPSNMGHTAIITINGSGNQNLSGPTTAYNGRMATLTIAKSGGTLYLMNYITLEGHYSYFMGTVDYTTNSNRVIFISNGKTILTNAAHTLGDVEFVGTGSSYTLTTTGAFNIAGTLYISGTSYGTMLTGTINSLGNITNTNTYASNMGHTATININGTGNQNFTGTTTAQLGRLPSIIINKASGTLYLINYNTTEGNWTYTAGTVDYTTNANRVIFISNGKTITTNAVHTLGDVEFVGTGASFTFTTTYAFNIAGTLYFSGTSYGTMLTGTINPQGNILITNSYASNMGHTATWNINGTGNENFTGTTTIYQGRLPSITINKNSGTLYLINYITTEGNWTYNVGTVDYSSNANRVIFISNGKTITTNANHTLGDVEFYGAGASGTWTTPSSFNITGTLYFTGTSYYTMLGGTANATGNIVVTNSYPSNQGHTATININGTSNQNFTGTTTDYLGRLPSITINKNSGTLYLINYITTEGNWTYNVGTVDYTSNANRVVFIANGKTITTNAIHTLGDVEFYGAGASGTWTTPYAFNITGTLYFTGSSYYTMLGGTANATGNILNTNSYPSNQGHTATININGTSNQNLTGPTSNYIGRLPSIAINKNSGTLYLINYNTTEGNWTYNVGTVDYSSNANRVVFIANGKTITTNATHTLGDVEFYGAGASGTWTTPSLFNITGTLYFTGSSYYTMLGGTANATGNITVTNSYPSNQGHTATINIIGTTNQNFTGPTTIYEGRLPNITINKATGTLYLINYITEECSWTYTTGSVDYSTNANRVIYIANGKTITTSAVHNLGDVEFYGAGASTTFTTPALFNITGTLYFTGNSYFTVLGGTANAKGNITVTNSYPSNQGHTGTFNINGTANQNFTGQTTIYEGRLPNVTINKASGTLYLINYITEECSWTYTTGTVDYSSNANRVIFVSNGKTITTSANHTIGDAEFYGTGSNTTLTTPSGFTIAGNLYITGTSYGTLLGGTANAQGNITVTNSYAGNNGHTATININGSANQLFTGEGTAGTGMLPNIVINKTGGTLTLAAPVISAEDSWTYTAGTVDPNSDTSSVVFYNSGKYISGPFYNATLMDVNRRTMNNVMSVSNILALGTGNIDMNHYTLSILNSSTSAITYSTGYVKSEQTDNSSTLAWTIGSTGGAHIFPLGTNAGVLIPYTFTLNSGNVGIFSVSTYPTNNTCHPYPVSPDSVLHVRNQAGFDNSANTVKRFWQLTKTGTTVNATVTFTAAAADVGSITSLRAQRYNKILNGWEPPLPGQTNPTAYSATVSGVTNFSPWTLSGNGSALPIQLVSFNAAYVNSTKTVHTTWTTASEINNHFFTIQRTADGVNFDSIGTVEGAGNSNRLLDYSFDDANPLQGVSYYRLLQTDFDGKVTTFNMVAVDVTNTTPTSIKIFPNPGNGTDINIIYSDDNIGDNVTFTISDLTGRTVAQTIVVNEIKGTNIYKLTPPTTLPVGMYFISAMINNNPYSMKMIVN